MNRKTLLVIFIAVAGAAALLERFVIPYPSDRVLADALTRLRDAKHASGVVTIGTVLPIKAQLGAAGATDIPIVLHGAAQFDLPDGGKGLVGETALTVVGSGRGGAKDVLVEVKALPQGAYARISNLPAVPGATLPGEMNGNWYSLDLGTLGSILASQGATAEEEPKDAAAASAVRDAYGAMRAMLANGTLLSSDGTSSIEIVDGALAYRFPMLVPPEAQVSFAEDMRVVLLGRPLGKDEVAKVDAEAKAGDATVTFWVDKRTHDLVKAEIDLYGKGKQGPITQSFRIDSIDLSAPAEVAAPESSTPFSEVIAKLHGVPMPVPAAPSAPAPKPPKQAK